MRVAASQEMHGPPAPEAPAMPEPGRLPLPLADPPRDVQAR
jgi:hypothetical protein